MENGNIEIGDVVNFKAICVYVNDEKYVFTLDGISFDVTIINEGNDKGALVIPLSKDDEKYNQNVHDTLVKMRLDKLCPITNNNCIKENCAWFVASKETETQQKELDMCSVRLLAISTHDMSKKT
jgi:hypothetical protein